MDMLSSLLNGPRARDAVVFKSVLDGPWATRFEDESPLTVIALVSGSAWVVPDEGEAQRMGPGDVVLVRGPGHYTVGDDPATTPDVLVDRGYACLAADRGEMTHRELGVRTWGNSEHGRDVLLIGSYQLDDEVNRRLLSVLPPLGLRPDTTGLIPLLAHEIGVDQPGQEVVLDRLLDLLLVTTLRGCLAQQVPRWYGALLDETIGPVLDLIHTSPERPWTLPALAQRAGVSRATFARRFAELVGEPPMTYLTDWRLCMAADRLRDTDLTLDAIARQVGYGSAFALSAAFKRSRGISPREWRAGQRSLSTT
ncbi:AraC family transcriptional regulator [Pseudonocardiaceae bacterium YIM PH 21723]|nr:AraC family transcriptional regulator [Pseudonocardiaceae bacterium YIM PH 21723]